MNMPEDGRERKSYVTSGGAIPTMMRDLEQRSRSVEWPAAFDPAQADWFSHNECYVEATPQRVWRELIAAPSWPNWYALCDAFEIVDGAAALSMGAQFRWTTFGITVEGTVERFEFPTRICWSGYEPGSAPTFYHAWLLEPSSTGCVVTYDESGHGPVAVSMRDRDEAAMHRGHDLLLAGLRWAAETPCR